jgi:hypothetical protein
MNQSGIFSVWRTLVICCVLLLFAIINYSSATADCKDCARINDEAVRAYRATVRDVSKSCTGDSIAECDEAKQAAEDAFSILSNAHQTVFDNCNVTPSGIPPNAGQLVITEIMMNPEAVSDTDGEWFEVFNPTALYLELQGLTVGDGAGDQFTIDRSVIISPDGFLVFGINDNLNQNGGIPVDYAYTGFNLSNNEDVIEISNGGTIIDRVEYNQTDFPIVAGKSTSLDPGAFESTLNDIGSNWCEAGSELPSGDYGTPGGINDDCGLSFSVQLTGTGTFIVPSNVYEITVELWGAGGGGGGSIAPSTLTCLLGAGGGGGGGGGYNQETLSVQPGDEYNYISGNAGVGGSANGGNGGNGGHSSFDGPAGYVLATGGMGGLGAYECYAGSGGAAGGGDAAGNYGLDAYGCNGGPGGDPFISWIDYTTGAGAGGDGGSGCENTESGIMGSDGLIVVRW